MLTNNKVKAFTLSEMVVVLIITTIVIGLAFSVLNLVQKHMMGIHQNFNNKTEFQKLEQVLCLDFNRYPNITFDAFEDKLIFKSELSSITYCFMGENVIKESDTFNIQVRDKQLFFDGNKTDNGNIDALKLVTSKENRNRALFVFKTNDATQFVNYGISIR
ncbi:PulJ/GspJ family protein [Seonamhaeicola maritimus]|uniref:Prepilin-type N-terminal cleavage/methylation domain-containing protein n=1 Tax=Seonamhaeicola maritimus TaxID=2591822 RepID=A0A5C7GEC8_9FLAO|nr:prepilin-type N-terminal cleavage/methylation domain-containing protein [Seonamhaeicola maritimus]TXG34840.1 prepilin-type N-terminal cleavage/methylation domain-containing protein [Seonamhaeicola maritimus]